MRIDLHHHYHYFDDTSQELNRKLNKILELLQGIKRWEGIMIQEMQDLANKVAEISGVEASAAAAIQAIVIKLNDLAQNATDLAEVKAAAVALANDLDAATAPLAAAIAAIPA